MMKRYCLGHFHSEPGSSWAVPKGFCTLTTLPVPSGLCLLGDLSGHPGREHAMAIITARRSRDSQVFCPSGMAWEPAMPFALPGFYLRSVFAAATYRRLVQLCGLMLSRVRLFETPWTVAHPPGSSVHGIFQARTLDGLPFPTLGDLPIPGVEPAVSGGS